MDNLELTERLIEIVTELLAITKEQNRILQQLDAASHADAIAEIERSVSDLRERR